MPPRKSPVRLITQKLDAGKATDIRVLDIRVISGFADTMIIATGTSTRHVLSLAYHLCEALHEQRIPASSEGMSGSGTWVIVDTGSIVVHIMTDKARRLYALEELWRPAPKRRRPASRKRN